MQFDSPVNAGMPLDVPAGERVLDDPQEWAAFSRPVAGREGWQESYLAIQGMHCASCALTVERALAALPGIDNVQVNGASATARVVWTPQASRPSHWMAALRDVGYGALPAGDLIDAAASVRERRVMLWRWLVAGFCMMQVMMYTVPAYVAAPGDMTSDIQTLLRWASWVLTLPVVLFSCWPFVSGALRDLRRRTIGMDVPVALGIAIAFAASTVATFEPAGPLGREVWYDSITMFVFFLLSGRLLEQRLRDRTAGSLDALMRRLPQTVERRCGGGGQFERVAIRRLVAGDAIRVRPGEVFPADGQVIDGETQVDEALLTGESRPISRACGQPVIAGSHNLSGLVLVRVERTGEQTRYSRIVALMEQASLEKPRLARMADRIAAPFLLAIVFGAAAAAAWWWAVDPEKALGIAIAVLIVTCPCALSLATPAATLAAAGALARQGVLVRRIQALEAAASVDTVFFDKTGTLTDDRMTLVAARTRAGADQVEALSMAGALAQHSLHPASRAIAGAAHASGWMASDVTEFAGRGVRGRIRSSGGDEHDARLGSAVFCGAPAGGASASAPAVHLADERGWLATFELEESIRPDAIAAVRALRNAGLKLELLSGDRAAAVTRLARRVGIETVHAQCTPEDKLERVRAAQARGGRVAMVGDGVNDGPVLARADLSIAMGEAVPLAQAKSDFVVLGGQLRAAALVIAMARRTRSIVRQNLAWAAAYNAVCVPLAAFGFMPPWLAGLGMAASSLLVVANSARLARADPRDPAGQNLAAGALVLPPSASPARP